MTVEPHSTYSRSALVNMAKGQLSTNGIHDERVLDALAAIDRSAFVPESLRQSAYVDDDIKLCSDRFLLEPLVFARMLVLAQLAPQHTVLDIGAGLGYSSAVMAQLAKRVYAIEDNAELVSAARKKLTAASVANVELVTAPLTQGCSAHQPYDRIIIEGALDCIPQAIEAQLAEHGTLIAIRTDAAQFATRKALSTLVVGTKEHGIIHYTEHGHLCAYPLQRSIGQEAFVF